MMVQFYIILKLTFQHGPGSFKCSCNEGYVDLPNFARIMIQAQFRKPNTV